MLISWKFLGVSVLILGLIALLAFGFTTNPKIVPSPFIGKPAPDFKVVHLNGKETLQLSELRGKPIVLNFWASWCIACRDEAPILKAFYEQYGVRQDKVHFVGIAIQDTLGKAKNFARQYQKKYFLALDGDDGAISLNYGIYGVPETFFIDAKGTIRFKHVGTLTSQVMEQQIQPMVKLSSK